jgi:hypothetical protein
MRLVPFSASCPILGCPNCPIFLRRGQEVSCATRAHRLPVLRRDPDGRQGSRPELTRWGPWAPPGTAEARGSVPAGHPILHTAWATGPRGCSDHEESGGEHGWANGGSEPPADEALPGRRSPAGGNPSPRSGGFRGRNLQPTCNGRRNHWRHKGFRRPCSSPRLAWRKSGQSCK